MYNNLKKEIRAELLSLAEPKYQKFASSLIPGVKNLIGVRIPAIRKIAKRIAVNDPIKYLSITGDLYFEELMTQALVIGNMKDGIDVILEQSALFIPKINNWSICDSFCNEVKIFRKHKDKVWKFAKSYLKSDKTYDIRTAVVIMLFHFIDDDYIDKMFPIFDNIKHQDYYVKMAVAWAVSICFVHYPEKTMTYLKNNKLDDETYNKSLQKIRESLRVSKETKEIIKSMRRYN